MGLTRCYKTEGFLHFMIMMMMTILSVLTTDILFLSLL